MDMGELSIVALADAIAFNKNISEIKGICYISKEIPENAELLPSYEECVKSPGNFAQFFNKFYQYSSTMSESILVQQCGSRYAVQNPPRTMSSEELDIIHTFDFEKSGTPA